MSGRRVGPAGYRVFHFLACYAAALGGLAPLAVPWRGMSACLKFLSSAFCGA